MCFCRCAVLTEFARDFLSKMDVKLVVPGEEEELCGSAASESDAQVEEKSAAKAVTVGEKYEVRSISVGNRANYTYSTLEGALGTLTLSLNGLFLDFSLHTRRIKQTTLTIGEKTNKPFC